jgi:hypothetical protein
MFFSLAFDPAAGRAACSHRLISTALAAAGWLVIAATAQAQVLRCTDARTGEITYTNGRCVSGEAAVQVQPASSPEQIAREHAQAAAAIERSKAEMARDEARRQEREKREERERRQQLAAAKAQAGSSSPACRQARQRLDAILAETSPDPATWGERSQAAQQQMEMTCLGPEAYSQLQQTRALQPNAINRPQYRPHGWTHPMPPQPPSQPAQIVNCNVFRCYDNRGGVHPVP